MVGWMSTERWGDFPVEVWMVNYPGFGHSQGPATLSSIVPAALDVYDALHAIAGKRPIFIDGNSFGAAVALHVATVRPTPALVLKNAPPLHQILLDRNGWWNLYLIAGPLAAQVPHELDAPTMAAKLSVPAAFMVAEKDTLVPPYYQAYVFDAYAGPKTIIRMPNLQHIDRADAASEKTLHDWIAARWQETLPTATAMHAGPSVQHLIASPRVGE
jgi:pimeloyl-ACP methyl ester carboxylesterase